MLGRFFLSVLGSNTHYCTKWKSTINNRPNSQMGLQVINIKYISIRPVLIDVEDKLMTFIKVDLSDFYI